MPKPLFNFELRPLELIQPWGVPHDPNLHWFGLTDGDYWIQVGNDILFEYSPLAQAQLGAKRFCDYQVVRLYEDLIEFSPYVLESVPEGLRRYIALDESTAWNHYWTKWVNTIGSDEESLDTLYDAGSWISSRTLDSAYLRPSTNVIFWSDFESVFIEWDNRDRLVEGGLAWSADFGRFTLSREAFVQEIRSFHTRLMAQMAERVSQIDAGKLPSGIRVDLNGLLKEQQIRSQPIDQTIARLASPTDWSKVAQAIQSLESMP
jgi:hypothetical protein